MIGINSYLNTHEVNSHDTSSEEMNKALISGSILELQTLLEMALANEAEGASEGDNGKPKNGRQILEGSLNRLALILPELMKSNPGKAKSILSKWTLLLEKYTDQDEETKNLVFKTLGPVVQQYLGEHPEEEEKVLDVFSPLIEKALEVDEEIISDVTQSLTQLEKSIQPQSKEAIAKGLREFHKVSDEASKLSSIVEEIYTNMDSDLQKIEPKTKEEKLHFYQNLASLVLAVTVTTKEKAKGLMTKFVKSGALEEFAEMPLNQQETLVSQVQTALFHGAREGSIKGKTSPLTDILNEALNQANSQDDSNSGSLAPVIAMMALTMFQISINKAQADEDQRAILEGQAMVQAAYKSQQKLDKEIQKEAQAEQGIPSWLMWIIKIFLAVIVLAIAAATGGMAGFFVAFAVTAFFTSPLSNMTVQAIASKIADALQGVFYNQYKAEGKSDAKAQELAKEKAQAVANIIAKIIVVVITIVVTAGVGGLASGLSGSASTTAESGVSESVESVGEEASEEGASEINEEIEASATEETSSAHEDGAAETAETNSGTVQQDESIEETNQADNNSSSRLSKAFKVGVKTGLMNGGMALGSTNIWMDFLTINPEWAKDHTGLVVALDVILEIVSALLTVKAGQMLMSSESVSSTGTEACQNIGKAIQNASADFGLIANATSANELEGFSGVLAKMRSNMLKIFQTLGEAIAKNFTTNLYRVLYGTQIIGNAAEASFGVVNAVHLHEASVLMAEIGEIEREYTCEMASSHIMNDIQRNNDTAVSNVTKGITADMQELSKIAGLEWSATDKALERRA